MHLSGLIKTITAGAVLALAGCIETPPTTNPQARPAGLPTGQPSAQSRALASYYKHLQADLLAQGLLRTDGGGPDTPFGPKLLTRDFIRIAFFDEYARGAGLKASKAGAGVLRRWAGPVRVSAEFGLSTPADQKAKDLAAVTKYVQRLNRITGHPISMRDQGANFHVMFLSEDDRPAALERIKQIEPHIQDSSLEIFESMPRSVQCLVIGFSNANDETHYSKAIALVRAEHPDLLRLSCIHEEIAQGLGLGNDYPKARPSIFNDDDEFALLTTHDEMLLRILYDPRLRAGMSAPEARPIIRMIADELTRGSS